MRLLLALAAANCWAVGSVTITERTGSTQGTRPFTISRWFAEGDIASYAKPTVSGTPLSVWQNDVKTRWPGGSLKHVLVSFQMSLTGSAVVTVDFTNDSNPCSSGNQSACDSAGLSDTASMLSPSWMSGSPPWDAQIEMTNGSTLTKNARTMIGNLTIAAGKIRYWMRGPVVTQVIVEDRTSTRAEDVGFDADNSLHPIFVLTFYDGHQGVKVEYIVESGMWSDKRQDSTYSLTLKAGTSLSTVYTKSSFTAVANTRWRKKFWSGTDLDLSSGTWKWTTDFDTSYLRASKAIPNFHASASVGAGSITSEVSGFSAANCDINANGPYAKDFGTTGGRPEIGLYDRWNTRWMVSQNYQLWPIILCYGEIVGSIPLHRREGASGSVAGGYFGKVKSLDYDSSGPTQTSVGTVTDGGWTVDVSHHAAFAFSEYLFTGDWYWLEEMQFSASWIVFNGDPGTCSYCRNAGMGIIPQPPQERGLAWGLRNVAHAAVMTPDADSTDKAYWLARVNNTLAMHEGKADLSTGSFNGTSAWTFGKNTVAPNGDGGSIGLLPNPLRFIQYNSNTNNGNTCGSSASTGLSCANMAYGSAMFMVNYLGVSLGRLEELGFSSAKVKESNALEGVHLCGEFSCWMLGSFATPRTRISDNKWFQSWSAYWDGWDTTHRARTGWSTIAPSSDDSDCDNGYANIARASMAYASSITPVVDGAYTAAAAYTFLETNTDHGCRSTNPKWDIVARAATASGASRVTSGKVTSTGKVVRQ